MTEKDTFIRKIFNRNKLISQLLFVVLAFALMVVSSCMYFGRMLHHHMQKEAQDLLARTKLKIETEIIIAETSLDHISYNMREIIFQGGDEKRILEYMNELTNGAKYGKNNVVLNYRDVYGYFDVFGGKLINGSDWSLKDDYRPEEQQWFKAAVEKGGDIAVVPVYIAEESNIYVMTYAVCVYGSDKERLFVLGFDIPLSSISDYVATIKLTENGYAILENENMELIAHPDQSLIGNKIRVVSQGLYDFATTRDKDDLVAERRTLNSYGERIVTYSYPLDNGWYLSIIIPETEYNRELVQLVVIIGILGSILAAVLIIILIRLDSDVKKADETARKQKSILDSLEQIREADERTQLMLDATPMGCMMWSRDCKLVSCNEEAVRVFGLSSKEEFCRRFYELSPETQPDGGDTRILVEMHLKNAFEKSYERFEWVHRKINGDPLPSEITLVRVKYKDDFVITGYIRDLTDHYNMINEMHKFADNLRVARDAAENANQTKSAFLANMSHEMRTPLNVVVGLTDLHMDEDDIPYHIKGDLKKINSAGNILLSIVNDVLDISKIEAGKLELAPVKYNAASLFNDIITLNIIRIENKPITFTINIDEKIPSELYGDELRLKQIFNNLLSNAFKYTYEGNVTLSVNCDRGDGDDIWMTIKVSDTGIGIRPDDLKKLFTDYNQVDTRANRQIEGTGLGLSITKKMIELMDGDISVESEYGKGTTFTAKIKQFYVDSKPLGAETVENLRSFRYTDNKQHVSAKIVRPDMSYAKVLIVDDFQTNLDVASGMMRKYKIQVDCLTNGVDSISRIKQGEPEYDAIFMDHMMPGMDGIETTKKIREIDTEYARSVPIISLTANAIAGNETLFLRNGFQEFLSKPIDIIKLDAVLKKWVRDKTKEITSQASSPAAPPGAAPESRDIVIPGIDTQKGLALYGDDAELFLTVIRSYALSTPAVLESMKTVTEEYLPAYAINVHGLKGSSGNIGAENVRKKALRLETAAKAGDLDKINAENGGLLEDAYALIKEINVWMEKWNSKNVKPQVRNPDPALLADVLDSCIQYNMNELDIAMERLESVSYETDGELVTWLREKVDISDFNAITGCLEDQIRKYQNENSEKSQGDGGHPTVTSQAERRAGA